MPKKEAPHACSYVTGYNSPGSNGPVDSSEEMMEDEILRRLRLTREKLLRRAWRIGRLL